MTVLNVAYPLLPVHSSSAGGAEQILSLVDRGLVGAGHRSLVVAARGSHVRGLLIETAAAEGQINDHARQRAQQEHLQVIEKTVQRYDVDLIHFHGLDFLSYLPGCRTPKLATLHLPLAWYPSEIFDIDGVTVNCVSRLQAKTGPSGVRLPVVANGIDVEAFCHPRTGGNGLLWLGRICPEKGVDIALRVALRLDRHLTIAGPVHPFEWHQKYFKEQVEPLLDDKRRYIGPVGFSHKQELLARADCVLIPSLAPETSSLVAMEAAAAGTPVIAFSAGALPEVIEHGRTGFLARNEHEMAEAVEHVRTLSADVCRQTAAQRFSFEKMVERYFSLYETILAGKSAVRQNHRHGSTLSM